MHNWLCYSWAWQLSCWRTRFLASMYAGLDSSCFRAHIFFESDLCRKRKPEILCARLSHHLRLINSLHPLYHFYVVITTIKPSWSLLNLRQHFLNHRMLPSICECLFSINILDQTYMASSRSSMLSLPSKSSFTRTCLHCLEMIEREINCHLLLWVAFSSAIDSPSPRRGE